MLDNKDLQAVVVSTPDHWHALLDHDGLRRRQGRLRRKADDPLHQRGPLDDEVARKHNRVVQVGTQQRSGKHYQHARELMQRATSARS